MTLLLVAMMVLAAIPAMQVNAAVPYTERFTGYVAGSSALWYVGFSGINASVAQLSAVEGIQGVSWYNLTALKTTGWSQDFQVFGPNGYNLIPVPFVPSQGVFLTVGAGSFSDASAAAADFNSYLLTTLVSLSNGTGSFTFFSPFSLSDIAPSTLLRLVPTGMGGFASVVGATTFAALASPIITLAGQRGTSGFTHTLVLGSISAGALDSSSRPNFLKYSGGTFGYMNASSRSSSSAIDFRFLDGIINSTDKAAAASNSAGSGSYSLVLTPGEKVRVLNVTVVEHPAQLQAQRFIDTGVLKPGQDVSVTISLTNPSASTSLSNVRVTDDWWKAYSFFKLVNGNSTIVLPSLQPGKTSTPTYVLEYNGTVTQRLNITSSTVTFSYQVGASSFKGSAALNPALLYIGTDEPAVYAYAIPLNATGSPVGTDQQFRIVAKNVGTRAASSVVIAGQPVGGLSADGGSDSITVSAGASSLLATNPSEVYTVSYSTPEGQSVSVATNSVSALFSHSSMELGLPIITASAYFSSLSTGGKTNLTLSFSVSNQGTANVTSFAASGTLPEGLSCGTVKGSGLSCGSGRLSISYPNLASKATKVSSVEFDLTSPANYFFSPLSFSGMTSGFNISAKSNAVAAPSGFVVTKQFSPSQLFPGMSTTVTVNAVNSGPFDVYNATVQSSVDSFDVLGPSGVPIKFSQTVAPGGNVTFSYSAVAGSVYGGLASSPATARIFFGGTLYSLGFGGPRVGVYQPVNVVIQSSPTVPVEGRPFAIEVTLNNPSNVTVSNVGFSLPIQSGITLSHVQNASFSGGTLVVSVGQLGPHSSYFANMTGQASSGLTILFSKGKLSFDYSGVTLNGTIPAKDIVVGEDVLTRYTLPTILVLVAVLATAIYVRRKAPPTVPVSQR